MLPVKIQYAKELIISDLQLFFYEKPAFLWCFCGAFCYFFGAFLTFDLPCIAGHSKGRRYSDLLRVSITTMMPRRANIKYVKELFISYLQLILEEKQLILLVYLLRLLRQRLRRPRDFVMICL